MLLSNPVPIFDTTLDPVTQSLYSMWSQLHFNGAFPQCPSPKTALLSRCQQVDGVRIASGLGPSWITGSLHQALIRIGSLDQHRISLSSVLELVYVCRESGLWTPETRFIGNLRETLLRTGLAPILLMLMLAQIVASIYWSASQADHMSIQRPPKFLEFEFAALTAVCYCTHTTCGAG